MGFRNVLSEERKLLRAPIVLMLLCTMAFSQAKALTIITHPLTQTNNEGELVTFTVSAEGVPPFTYQWLKGDEFIPGATNDTYSIAHAAISDVGVYSVSVSDTKTNLSSMTAGLWIVAQSRSLLALTNYWRYNAGGTNLGVSWRGTNYNDGFWPTGPGCFGTGYLGNTSSPLTDQIKTLLPLTNANNAKITTYYFRTHFTISNNPLSVILTITNLVDDGAVFYVNSNEVSRFNMPNGGISFITSASSSVDANYQTFSVPPAVLIPGENTLAAEVHNFAFSSLDIGFGADIWAAYDAVGPPNSPLIISRQPVSQVVLEGEAVMLEAGISGPSPSLQWYKDGSLLSGQTNLVLRIAQSQPADMGKYFLIASNAFGRVYTDLVQLSVIGDSSFRYSLFSWTNTWRYTTSSIVDPSWKDTLYDDTFWNSGSGKFGASSSGSVPTLTYLPPSTNTIFFRTHFQLPYAPQSVFLISSNLVADGAIFYPNGIEVSRYRLTNSVPQHTLGAGSTVERTNLPTANLRKGDNVMAVELRAAPNSGLPAFAESLVAVPITNFPLTILREPADLVVPDYGTLSFAGDAFGSPPIFFQWFHDDTIIFGATNKTLILSNSHASDAGLYFFVATNAGGAITSSVARASVPPLIITNQPADVIVPEHGTIHFLVSTLGSAPAIYQWFHEGSAVSAATNKSLSISNAHPLNAGEYFFVATTAAGAVTSTVAQAMVIADSVPPVFLRAVATSPRTIVVEFSERVERNTALDVRNYSFSPPIQVTSLSLLEGMSF